MAAGKGPGPSGTCKSSRRGTPSGFPYATFCVSSAAADRAVVRCKSEGDVTNVRMEWNSISRLVAVMLVAGCLWGQRQVAITIDDLPRGGDAPGSLVEDRAMTVKLLTAFKRDQIPLTGFVNECRHANEPDLLQLWAAAGADLGNHTCSHLDLNSTSAADFDADVLKGEAATTAALGRPPRYFRYPYLHTGQTPEAKEKVEAFIQQRGYLMAPVTLDDEDYVFARVYADDLAKGQTKEAARVLAAYVPYMESILAFFEHWGTTVTGHDVETDPANPCQSAECGCDAATAAL